MREVLATAPAGRRSRSTFTREGTGTLFYMARLRYAVGRAAASEGLDQRLHGRAHLRAVRRDRRGGRAATTFKAGDLVRVTLTLAPTKERRFVAVTDPLPAGFEPVESWFATTAADLAREQRSAASAGDGWMEWWERGGFDHVERHDDRVQLFATRLSEGAHVSRTSSARRPPARSVTAPTHAEEMYEPEVFGRTATAVMEIRR